MTRRTCLSAAALSAFLASAAAVAHHSYTEFDDKTVVEIEGLLVGASWQNPHTNLTVRASDGSNQTWDIETSPINYLRRLAAPLELFEVGTTVKVAGWPSKRVSGRMYGTNILSADGKELILFRSTPRWNATALGTERRAPTTTGEQSRATIFRVWDVVYAAPGEPVDPETAPGALRRVPLPLTEAARAAVAAFDPVNHSTTVGCEPKGMPAIMNVPVPLEFVEGDGSIVLRIEEYDTVRVIHLEPSEGASAVPKSALGYSIGHWEGDTLVVETTRVNALHLTAAGVPLGPSASFLERFTPSSDGQRLRYSILMTDPYSLSEPTEQTRSWVATSEKLLPFNCTVAGANRP